MSHLRIKIVYEDDIRMFKAKSNTDSKELLSKIMLFIKEAHDIGEFRLVFKDDEGDEITIVDNDDLEEALISNNDKKVTKLHVKAIQQTKDEEEIEDEDEVNSSSSTGEDETQDERKHRHHKRHHRGRYHRGRYHRGGHHGHGRRFFNQEETENENNNNFSDDCIWLKFLDDVSKDEELKKEFISFLTVFITSLQNEKDNEENPGALNNGSELFIKALSLQNKLNKHEIMSKFVSEKLDLLFYQFPHLLHILKQINTKDIPKLIDLILDSHSKFKNSTKSNNFSMLPPFLFPFFGLFGGFHGRRHPHRRKHHHRGRHHGHGGRFFSGRQCGKRGGRQCREFFDNNNFRRYKKHKDLRADIIDENITLGKNAFVNGNQTLIKTWKMKNVGKKVIPANCTAEYFGREFNLMIDGTKFELKNNEIKINEEFEVSVVIKSPKENGKYKSKWKLITPDGFKFGQPLIVSFVVNDFNDNNKNKEFKKLRKTERKNFKKQDKFLRKEEKLRHKREKLLEKLEQLQQQSNKLDNINRNDDKDDVKEEFIEENNQTGTTPIGNNNIDSTEDEIFENKHEIISESDDTFIYKVQLEQLKNMGFNDENELKQLLEINSGSVESVLNDIMQN